MGAFAEALEREINGALVETNVHVESVMAVHTRAREERLTITVAEHARQVIESAEALGIDAAELRRSRQRALDTLAMMGSE